MSEAARLQIEMGAMAEPFAAQLERQHLGFDASTIDHLWNDSLAASRLTVRGVLSRKASDAAYDKIAKRVWSEVRRAGAETMNLRASTASPLGGPILARDEPLFIPQTNSEGEG